MFLVICEDRVYVRWGKMEAQIESESLVNVLTNGAVTIFSGSLFRCLGCPAEKASLILTRVLLKVVPPEIPFLEKFIQWDVEAASKQVVCQNEVVT